MSLSAPRAQEQEHLQVNEYSARAPVCSFVRGREVLVEPSAPLRWNQPQILGSPVPSAQEGSLVARTS